MGVHKKRGRPRKPKPFKLPKPKEPPKTERILLLIDKELKEYAVSEAKRMEISVSQYIRDLIFADRAKWDRYKKMVSRDENSITEPKSIG